MRTLEEMLEVHDVGDLTLVEDLELTERAISGLQAELLDGGIWKPRTSGGSFKTSAIVDRLLSCLGQATVAHCRLHYWTGQNEYATGLPIRTILQNYTLGSMLLRELIDSLSLAIEYCEDWRVVRDADNKLPETYKIG